MRPRIFVTQPVSRSAIERLRRVASVRVNPDSSRIIPKKALLAAVRASDIVFSLLHDRIDREVLAANPKLAAVASQSITPDNIDVAEATRRKIPVTVVPPIVAELGGSTSHLASLARERGIPMVLGVLDATRHIPDGVQVAVDGVAGIVRWVR